MPEEMLIALRLSKEGFGRPDEILNMRTDVVIAAMEYSEFLATYQRTHYELNKNESR